MEAMLLLVSLVSMLGGGNKLVFVVVKKFQKFLCKEIYKTNCT